MLKVIGYDFDYDFDDIPINVKFPVLLDDLTTSFYVLIKLLGSFIGDNAPFLFSYVNYILNILEWLYKKNNTLAYWWEYKHKIYFITPTRFSWHKAFLLLFTWIRDSELISFSYL